MQPPEADFRRARILEFSRVFGLGVAFLAVLPAILGFLATPDGARYLGYQWAVDDQMVYAAWMTQAQEGRFFFENRFTTEPQPGLTVHLYFLALGWVASVIGIPLAETLARFAFSLAFVLLLGRLLVRSSLDIFPAKLAIAIATFGGGLGFLVWQKFGEVISDDHPAVLAGLFRGRLSTDVYQPEGFVFPSMLVNSLFLISLCLILIVFLSVLDARTSWKPVLSGAIAYGLLMNIHSYDVALIALVLVGLAVASLASGTFRWNWAGRVLVIGAGALPGAAWFLYVLQRDPVFQERAATPTFSPMFWSLLLGYLPAIAFAVVGLAPRPTAAGFGSIDRQRWGAIALAAGVIGLGVGSWNTSADRFSFSPLAWVVLLGAAMIVVALLARPDPVFNLVSAWAVIGAIAPYIPFLFQRKLTMGLMIPWAILAAVGLASVLDRLERPARNLVAALGLVILSGSSLLWFFRENQFRSANVARTVLHPVYLSREIVAILDRVRREPPGERVVLAMPGINPSVGPDRFDTPYLPDLNPFLTGLAGAKTWAGHWSETPQYRERRREAFAFFQAATPDAFRRELLARSGARLIVAPLPEAFPELEEAGMGLVDPKGMGEVLLEGARFILLRVSEGRESG